MGSKAEESGPGAMETGARKIPIKVDNYMKKSLEMPEQISCSLIYCDDRGVLLFFSPFGILKFISRI